MAEFSAEDALKSRWSPACRAQGIRLLTVLGGLCIAVAVAGFLTLRFVGPVAQSIGLLLVVVCPLLGAGAFLGGAAAIQFHALIGQVLKKTAIFIFCSGAVGLVVGVWAVALLLRLVDAIAAAQTESARQVLTSFGGELTFGEIQAYLTGADHAVGGLWGMAAVLLWPLQFGIVRDVLGVLGVLGFVSLVAMFAIWWERKVAGRIQSRLGPMRVGGWHGWAQSLADGLKLIQKEDLVTAEADQPLFRLAPYLAFVPALSAFATLPFGALWIFRDLDVGLVFILSMLGIEVVGVILAGWASNNKWSVYGGMREACQMVSYEIPMGLTLLVPVLTVGTLKLPEIGAMQAGGFHTWLVFSNPFIFVAALLYFIASLANCKRAPFDLPEAESELVAGFMTEYSGFRWCLFFFAEYAAMYVVSGLLVILFLGAWHSPLPATWGRELYASGLWGRVVYGVLFSGPLWFIGKCVALIYLQMWVRWTLPRIRLDQVMYACVQVLLPVSMVVLLGATFWSLFVEPGTVLARIVNVVLTLVGAALLAAFVGIMLYGFRNRRRLVGTLVIDHLPGA